MEVNALHPLRAGEELSLYSIRRSATEDHCALYTSNASPRIQQAQCNGRQESYLDIQSHIVWGKAESRLCAASEMIDQEGNQATSRTTSPARDCRCLPVEDGDKDEIYREKKEAQQSGLVECEVETSDVSTRRRQ